MKRLIFLLVASLSILTASSQSSFPVNGSWDKRPQKYAFVNATIVVSSDLTITNATLLVSGETIEAVGVAPTVVVPKGYLLIDLKGKYIYPSFVDAFTNYGLPGEKPSRTPLEINNNFVSSKKGAYSWNEAIKSEFKAANNFVYDAKSAQKLRKLGFGAVNTLSRDGIARGTSAVVTLANGKEQDLFVSEQAASSYSFDKGSSKTDYPASLMGAIALLRQTYLDGKWYAKQRKEYNITLDEFNRQQYLPQIFEANDVFDVLRADKVGDEFGRQYVIKTKGDEFKKLKNIKDTKATLIVPINYPKPYDVEDISVARNVSLAQMKYWELAPANLAFLDKAKVKFAITTADLEDLEDFWKNLRKALDNGLSERSALRALTEVPAEILGISDKVGRIEQGKLANFIITSGNIFTDGSIVYENWIKGEKYTLSSLDKIDVRGEYYFRITGLDTVNNKMPRKPLLTVADTIDYKLRIGGTMADNEVFFEREVEDLDTMQVIKGAIYREEELVNIHVDFGANPKGAVRFSGYIASANPLIMRGKLVYPDGSVGKWEAGFQVPYRAVAQKATPKFLADTNSLKGFLYAYGAPSSLKSETVIFKNATVWTNEKEGRIYDADVIIEGGKIKAVGKGLATPPGAKVINAKGKHITPGIIDEHSHIAISGGVNEPTRAISSEVSVGSVLNPEDVNIYRELSGGVTSALLLHGSANPIGGQAALVKLKWGEAPDGMLYNNTPGFIKFALGENVKQSNWGDKYTARFPQSRMGVEQVFVDAFTRAREYKQSWDLYKSKKGSVAEPRKDLALETLVEVLDGKRNITCHSYVQSEISMLMSLSDSLGFKINTFTHILEGYKVADKLRLKKIAAGTFSDWWAYKSEVSDAIPYNAALMAKEGVLVSLNSDDPEMARRLNQEAAKTMKYGGLHEIDAVKMITLNPARMLRIENRVGSLKSGKDADIVVWDSHPLSVYAKVEKTYIEGIPYYDAERDVQVRREMAAERARIIQLMIEAKARGEKTQPLSSNSELYSESVQNH